MKRIQVHNLVSVAEIDPSPTIYEELENGKLRVVDTAELGIFKSVIPALPDLSIDNASLNPRRRDSKSSTTVFRPQEFGELKIYEETADGKLRHLDLKKFGITSKSSRNPAPSLG